MEIEKGKPIYNTCEQIAIEIGRIGMEIEFLSRQPPSFLNESILNMLMKTLESLQNEYRQQHCMSEK